MQSVIQSYYHVNKTFMLQVGIWPNQSRLPRIFIPMTMAFINGTLVLAEIIRMFDTWGDIDIAVECIISVLIEILGFTKLFNLSFKINKIQNLFSLIEYHWKVFNNSTDVKILENYVIFTRKVIIFYAIYVYVSMILFMITPITPQIMDFVIPLNETRQRKYLFETEYRIDREKYYYFILLHSYLGSMVVMSIVVCVDTTYIACVQHGCSLFAAIGYRLENIVSREISQTSYLKKNEERTYGMEDIDDIDFKERIFRELIICLKKHQLALEYARILESSFMLSTGIQLSCNMLLLSLTGIQIMSNLGNMDECIRYICLCAGALFHLLCMSLPGQILIDHSINVFNKACRSHWYTFSLKSKALLRILLYRSVTPCTLTAGKIYVMSMANYSMVLQTAMSYFMTFYSLK